MDAVASGAIMARTNDAIADGEIAWSWRPDAGAKLFGKRLEVVELGTAARHQVGIETPVSLPRESCWAYRDTGPVSYE